MKKYLPFLVLGLGVVIVVGAFFVIRSRNSGKDVEEEKIVELPIELRPYTQLIPGEDGHRLVLKVSDINVPGAVSMDYELLYQTADGRPQGVPGLVDLEGGLKDFERELLLGSESSGVERYDEGVEEGTLTLKFRDDRGKFLGKVITDFHLLNGTKSLNSIDGKFVYTLDKLEDDVFFVVMNTFGLPTGYEEGWDGVSYGVFASINDSYPGDAPGWENLLDDGSVGVFVASN